MQKISKTPYHSWRIGKLPKGCEMCVKGLKEVVFVTGICPRKPSCYFCPISDRKFAKDVIYANEWPIDDLKNLVVEAKLCESKGAGLTGGDPLARLDRTLKIIKLLKKNFGKKFHIHLYTPLELVSQKSVSRLEKAGLDEIRFHPDIGNDLLWGRISVKTKMAKGVEIPVIPGKEAEIKKLIGFIADKVSFLNLNELELSDTNVSKLYEYGFIAKDNVSYAVKGSEKLAKRLLSYCLKNTKLDVHYCSVRLKDNVQLVNRIKRRARHVKKPYDFLTKNGSLVRGAIYLLGLTPELTAEKLNGMRTKMTIALLNAERKMLMKKFSIPPSLIAVDERKLRILTTVKVVEELKKELKRTKLSPAIVEELPTYDQFEIQNEML